MYSMASLSEAYRSNSIRYTFVIKRLPWASMTFCFSLNKLNSTVIHSNKWIAYKEKLSNLLLSSTIAWSRE